jgi:hypothetical protein
MFFLRVPEPPRFRVKLVSVLGHTTPLVFWPVVIALVGMLPQVLGGGMEPVVLLCSGYHPYRNKMAGRKPYLSVHSMLFLLVPLLEFLDPAGRINQLLFARIERMAVRADIHGPAFDGGAGLVRGAAGAGKGGIFVFRVQVFFHRYYSLGFICFKEQGFLSQKPVFSKQG